MALLDTQFRLFRPLFMHRMLLPAGVVECIRGVSRLSDLLSGPLLGDDANAVELHWRTARVKSCSKYFSKYSTVIGPRANGGR